MACFKGSVAGAENAGRPSLSSSKAWRKLTPSNFSTNWIALPAAPQPMQWNRPLSGLTMNEAVSSVWNGHRPAQSFVPCLPSSTPRERTSAARSVSRLIRAISSSGIRGMAPPLRRILGKPVKPKV